MNIFDEQKKACSFIEKTIKENKKISHAYLIETNDYYNYNDSDYNYDNDNSDYMSRTQRQARKKRANEETEYWGEWKGSDEGDEIK